MFAAIEQEMIDATEPEVPEIDSSEIGVLVDSLPPASKTVIRMHYLEQMSFVEIGEALELPIGTVKSRLAYGLSVLRGREK